MAVSKKEFLRAYEAYADDLFRFCYLRVSDRETAKDLLQTCLCRTWEYLAAGGQIRNWRAFLYQTARHLIIDHYREKAPFSLDALLESGFDQSEAARSVEERLLIKQVIEAFDQLPAADREALFLRFVEGLPVKEIAVVMKETPNAVSVRLHRAIKKLKLWIKN